LKTWPLPSRLMQLLGPQKMNTVSWLPLSSSCLLRSTLWRLEWATTRRFVRRPTSCWYPALGASFIRITHSERSISSPLLLPVSWPELVTRAQVLQCIFRGCGGEKSEIIAVTFKWLKRCRQRVIWLSRIWSSSGIMDKHILHPNSWLTAIWSLGVSFECIGYPVTLTFPHTTAQQLHIARYPSTVVSDGTAAPTLPMYGHVTGSSIFKRCG